MHNFFLINYINSLFSSTFDIFRSPRADKKNLQQTATKDSLQEIVNRPFPITFSVLNTFNLTTLILFFIMASKILVLHSLIVFCNLCTNLFIIMKFLFFLSISFTTIQHFHSRYSFLNIIVSVFASSSNPVSHSSMCTIHCCVLFIQLLHPPTLFSVFLLLVLFVIFYKIPIQNH